MSKSSTGKRASQRGARKERRQKKQIMLIGGSIGLIAAIIAVIFLVRQASPPVTRERLEQDPVLGEADAPVTIIEYAAYSCPACQGWHQSGTLDQIMSEYPGQVRYIFRDFPVITPTYDQQAAEAAQCALDQGSDAFWTMHDVLYGPAFRTLSTKAALASAAGDAGLDAEALLQCLDQHQNSATVRYDQTRATQLGLTSTPTFVVNGQVIIGGSIDALRQAINTALANL